MRVRDPADHSLASSMHCTWVGVYKASTRLCLGRPAGDVVFKYTDRNTDMNMFVYTQKQTQQRHMLTQMKEVCVHLPICLHTLMYNHLPICSSTHFPPMFQGMLQREFSFLDPFW